VLLVKLPNLKLKTRPKQLLGSLPLVITLLAASICNSFIINTPNIKRIKSKTELIEQNMNYSRLSVEERKQQPSQKDLTYCIDFQLHENALYNGSSNPLSYFRSFDLTLRCNFKFDNYPFDSQNCTVAVTSFQRHKTGNPY